METKEPQALHGSSNKKAVAGEILFIQKTIGYSLLIAIGVAIFCLFLFSPFKFDDEKYRNITGISQSSGLTSVYSPLRWSDGFYEYCDDKIAFNPYSPQASYYARKQYLIWKSFRMGLYTWMIAIVGVLLYRYGLRGQRWIKQHAQ